ncbi:hypothetical protein GCM10017044_12610 [Kordiimonas sediminis]|uniref:Pyridoxamine 5'-phosphate oxidase family protein n=2 Tax=Kordiimonas sediminis TaxID=1735581 RepID=A0A919E7A3_9PROT|nr:hypothetical protein GCM10017044_12610 [Kordiimonas sediminis]
MIKALSTGEREACVTVSHLDGLVLARSGFNTSVNYRSAICMGRPELITDKDEVIRQFELFFNRLAPGRWDTLRPMADQELKATGMLKMDIVDFAVKERAGGPSDSVEADHDIWAGHIPITTEIGTEVTATDSKRADLNHEVMHYSF